MATSPQLYEIKDAPNHGGKGMFATSAISRGQVILEEAPLISVPTGTRLVDDAWWEHEQKSPKWTRNAIIDLREKAPENLNALRDLFSGSSAHARQTRKDFDIISHNSWNFMPLDNNQNRKRKVECIVYNDISRVNHSCVPNAFIDRQEYPRKDKYKHARLIAARSIAQGEQIFIDYIPEEYPALNTEARKIALNEGWEFDCQCPSCSNEAQADADFEVARQHLDQLENDATDAELDSRIHETRMYLQLLDAAGREPHLLAPG